MCILTYKITRYPIYSLDLLCLCLSWACLLWTRFFECFLAIVRVTITLLRSLGWRSSISSWCWCRSGLAFFLITDGNVWHGFCYWIIDTSLSLSINSFCCWLILFSKINFCWSTCTSCLSCRFICCRKRNSFCLTWRLRSILLNLSCPLLVFIFLCLFFLKILIFI